MRVLVCGGRNFEDHDLLRRTLNDLDITHVIEGGARGADRLAYHWAECYGIPTTRYSAQWALYGTDAGPIRNQLMIDDGKPDLVVAFDGGKGTANMVRKAKAAGIPVREVK